MISKLQLMKTLLLGTIIGTKQDVAKPILADTATSSAVFYLIENNLIMLIGEGTSQEESDNEWYWSSVDSLGEKR